MEVRGAGLGTATAFFARLLRAVSSAFLFVPFIPEEIVVVLGSCEYGPANLFSSPLYEAATARAVERADNGVVVGIIFEGGFSLEIYCE